MPYIIGEIVTVILDENVPYANWQSHIDERQADGLQHKEFEVRLLFQAVCGLFATVCQFLGVFLLREICSVSIWRAIFE